MNLSNYFFRTDSIVLISITCSLLALDFMHEIMETLTSDSCEKFHLTNVCKFHGHQSMKLQLSYEITFGYVQKLQIAHLIPLKTIKFVKALAGPVFRPNLLLRFSAVILHHDSPEGPTISIN